MYLDSVTSVFAVFCCLLCGVVLGDTVLGGVFFFYGWQDNVIVSSAPGVVVLGGTGFGKISPFCAINCIQIKPCHAYYICRYLS